MALICVFILIIIFFLSTNLNNFLILFYMINKFYEIINFNLIY